MEALKVIFYLVIFSIVLWGAYYTSKKMSSFTLRYSQSRYMKMVDKLILNKEVGLAIVKIGCKYMLVSLANNQVSLLKELSEEELVEYESNINFEETQLISIKSITDKLAVKIIELYKKCKSFILKIIEKYKDKIIENKKMLKEKSGKSSVKFSDLLKSKSIGSDEIKESAPQVQEISIVDELLGKTTYHTSKIKNKITGVKEQLNEDK